MAGELDHHLWDLGFPRWQNVSTRRSIAGLIKGRERRGVYVLGFGNGERYVGLTTDVVKRFIQHQVTHPDIVQITFKPVPTPGLRQEERRCIHALEAAHMPLRNLAEMSVIRGDRTFDRVVSRLEQERWLAGEALPDEDQRVLDEDLRRRYQGRYETFRRQRYASDAELLLGTYLEAAIPAPNRTELTFWSMSCLPGGDVYSRVNLNMQEVLTIRETPDGLFVAFHVAKSPFEEDLGPDWEQRLKEFYWPFDLHTYKPGGGDQFTLLADFELALVYMFHPVARHAMSLMNMRLMRKGPTYYASSHCIDLVTEARSTFERRQPDVDALLAPWRTDSHGGPAAQSAKP